MPQSVTWRSLLPMLWGHINADRIIATCTVITLGFAAYQIEQNTKAQKIGNSIQFTKSFNEIQDKIYEDCIEIDCKPVFALYFRDRIKAELVLIDDLEQRGMVDPYHTKRLRQSLNALDEALAKMR